MGIGAHDGGTRRRCAVGGRAAMQRPRDPDRAPSAGADGATVKRRVQTGTVQRDVRCLHLRPPCACDGRCRAPSAPASARVPVGPQVSRGGPRHHRPARHPLHHHQSEGPDGLQRRALQTGDEDLQDDAALRGMTGPSVQPRQRARKGGVRPPPPPPRPPSGTHVRRSRAHAQASPSAVNQKWTCSQGSTAVGTP